MTNGPKDPDDSAWWGEDRFRVAFEHASVGVAVTDADGQILEANPAYCRITGYSEDELRLLDFPSLTHPDDRPAHAELVRRMLEGSAPAFVLEKRYVRKGGGIVWVQASVSLVRDGPGRPHRIIALTEDVTDRKRAEERVRASEERNRLLLDSAGEALYGTDTEGLCIFCNPACLRLLGYERSEDLLGRNLHHLIHHSRADGTHLPEQDCLIFRAFRKGEGTQADHEVFWRADGTAFPVAYRSHPIRKGDQVIGTVVTFEDITERKRAEATIAEQVRLAEYGREVGRALTQGGTMEEVLARCAGATVRHLDGAFARVWTVDEAGEVLELRASAGMYTHLDGPHARVPVGQFKIGQIARDRQPHLTNSVVGDPLVPAQEWARAEGMVAFAGYPLVVEDHLVGVLAMFSRNELSDAALRMMGSVADEIAVGIEREQVEERLHRQREWLRVTLASIGDAVIATDLEGRITFLNGVAEALTGWSGREAAGRPLGEVFRIVDEETRREVESPALRALREGTVVGLANHTVLIARDGTERVIDDSVAPIRDEAGGVMGAVLIFRDVAERRLAERALEASEARKAAILETALDAIITIDHEGLVVEWNPAAEKIFGLDRAAIQGREMCAVIIPEAFREAHRRGLARYLETGEGPVLGRRFEITAIRADGTEFPVELAITRITTDGPPMFTAHLRDITEAKQAENEMRHAKEEAEAANQAKTRFLAVLSHELRTPLNPILLAASSMLERPADPKEFRPTLEMIRQNVNLQARLIDDLLDVMRIVRGKMPLHWEVADCHKLVDQAVQICRSEVFGHDLRLIVERTARHRHVNADPARLQQVLWNLIRNAVKFTPEGGSVTIRTRNVDEADRPEGLIVIEVTDTGIGIEPDVLPVIFDPFQQGESTITRKFGGLGLGLAICKGIVDGHGGTIVAESPGKGHGSTFRVVLRALPDPTAEEDSGTGGGGPAVAEGAPAMLRILTVEDEPTTLRLMARLLRGLGHEVATAGSVSEATRLHEGGTFDLIISDIGLPDGTGLDLMRRAVALRGPTPSIALTGYGMEEDIRRSREAGFTAHLTKPIDFSKLEAMIRQIAPNGS